MKEMEKTCLHDNESLLCTIHSNDANHQAENLINWQQQFDQLSRGRFVGVINEIHFPDIHVFREETSQQLRQQCQIEEGGLWLGFSADNKRCRINNQATRSEQFLCRPGGHEFELLTPENFSIFGLVLHRSWLKQWLEQNEELADNAFDCLYLEGVAPQLIFSFRQYLSLLLQADGHRWSSLTQQLILKDAVFELLSLAQNAPATTMASAQRQRLMQRVKSYLHEVDLSAPLTIDEICAAVHVSRRTLQYAFSECLGMSPKHYIKVIRLNQIRRALLQSEQQQTIAEIALEHGFFHLGQFGQDYKNLFGENPQQTRHRHFSHS